jgi:hypothetical protein
MIAVGEAAVIELKLEMGSRYRTWNATWSSSMTNLADLAEAGTHSLLLLLLTFTTTATIPIHFALDSLLPMPSVRTESEQA